VNLQASEDVLVRRLSGRRVCSACGANYHVENMPPKIDGVCDKCGGAVIQREDDKLEAIRNRLKVYEEKTAPVIGYYAGKSILRDVDASEEANIVLGKIESLLKDIKV